MARFALDRLRANSYEPVVAAYSPFSLEPDLSVRATELGRKTVGVRATELFGAEAYRLGAWLPELEFTQYLPTAHWRRLVDSCARHLAVSGSCLAGLPFVATGTPALTWVASPWMEDRADRFRGFGVLRRIADRTIVQPVARCLERRVLRGTTVAALSEYTRARLDSLAGRPVCAGIVPTPVDVDLFRPEPAAVRTGLIGFAGRLTDPRKNCRLFLDAIRACQRPGVEVRGLLIGLPPADLDRLRREAGSGLPVSTVPPLPLPDYGAVLRSLDLFVVPSRQEGLCISALEAMASGCPVVSTRCGGPEEYVVDDVNGYLVGFDAREMADAILRVVGDRARRTRLGANAREAVRVRYSAASAARFFDALFESSAEAKNG